MEETVPGKSPSSMPDDPNKAPEITEPGLNGDTSAHHHHHSHHRHRSRFSRLKRPDANKHSRKRKYRKIEALMSNSVLRTVGVILIILGIWFAIDPMALVRSLWNFIINEGSGSSQFLNIQGSWYLPVNILLKLALGFLITGVFFGLAIWRKSLEMEIIAQAAWFIFGAWWIVTFYATSSPLLYFGYILTSTAFFILFVVLSMFLVSFAHRKLVTRILEGTLILANGGFYYLTYYIFILPSRPEVILFTIALLAFLLFMFYIAEKKEMDYSRIPFFIFSGLVASAVFPLFTGGKDFVLFFSVFSILMMLLLGTSRNNIYFFVSTGAVIAACLLLIVNIIFRYVPYLLIYPGTPDEYLVFKGSVAFLAVLTAFYLNSRVLRKNHLHISKKWYRKVEFLKFMKGGRLTLIYLGGLWVYFFFLYLVFPESIMKFSIWFSFHCLFFIVALPRLVRQNSSFVPPAYFAGGVLTLLYPVLIQPDNSYLRDSLITYGGKWLPEFAFHYLNVLLFAVLLIWLLRFARKGMPWAKTSREIAWFFILTMSLYLLYTELVHIIVLMAYHHGWIVSETLAGFRKVPLSLMIAAVSLVILAMGFLRKEPFLRVYSLLLLGLAILKVILSDIMEAGSWTRTIIYISLGTILIIVSFYYSRIKKFYSRKRREERRKKK